MKSVICASAFLATLAAAAPAPALVKRADIDPTILNYALTLEHLEATFYAQGLAKYTAADFAKAGFSGKNFYSNLKRIAKDEATHVAVLTSVLKSANQTATAACTYKFPYTTPAEFVTLASVLEGVGVTAYLGAAALVTNKQYLTAAGSILTVEARHNAFIRGAKGQSPFPQAFDTPLDFDQVYSLAAPFIIKCPSTNPTLPVKAFPALTPKSSTAVQSGSTITFTMPSGYAIPSTQLYVAWPTVTGPIFQTATVKGDEISCTVPAQGAAGPAGQAYAILTDNKDALTDDHTVAGPAIVNIVVQ